MGWKEFSPFCFSYSSIFFDATPPLYYPAKSKRGREEGDGTENVINCRDVVANCRDIL